MSDLITEAAEKPVTSLTLKDFDEEPDGIKVEFYQGGFTAPDLIVNKITRLTTLHLIDPSVEYLDARIREGGFNLSLSQPVTGGSQGVGVETETSLIDRLMSIPCEYLDLLHTHPDRPEVGETNRQVFSPVDIQAALDGVRRVWLIIPGTAQAEVLCIINERPHLQRPIAPKAIARYTELLESNPSPEVALHGLQVCTKICGLPLYQSKDGRDFKLVNF